ncbi:MULTISPECIES: hypothetical protein [Streptomyces]|uniref:DUF2568 domain-containing protein n=1 Tax=Streptomyces galilaeus TaxID=33899 RepID=A0ABW9IKZ5_STRGJ
MNTQQTSWALAREAAGLCLTALGVLGVLVALGALHWAAGLSAVMCAILALGVLIVPKPDGPRRAHVTRLTLCIVGYGGLTGCTFVLNVALGWVDVALAVTGIGLWLTTDRESEGA